MVSPASWFATAQAWGMVCVPAVVKLVSGAVAVITKKAIGS